MSADTSLDVVLLADNSVKVFSGNNVLNVTEVINRERVTLAEQDAYKQYIGLGGFNVYHR